MQIFSQYIFSVDLLVPGPPDEGAPGQGLQAHAAQDGVRGQGQQHPGHCLHQGQGEGQYGLEWAQFMRIINARKYKGIFFL